MTTAKKKAPAKKVAPKGGAKPVVKNSPSIVEEKIDYQIGIRELRQDASRVIGLVEGGASVTITRHGKVVATINPPEKTQLEKWIEEGAVTFATKKLDLRNWKSSEPYDGPDFLELLLKERREARY
jgi:antitoxin (DNA-binding transcriptional repressor) of toxin-antitoxin stability system